MSRRLGAAAVVALLGCSCHESTPVEPETRPVLVLVYSGPCGSADAAVSIDGVPAGRVRIPGATSFLVAPGHHDVQVGSTPSFTVDMPADRDLSLTDVPSPCP